MCALVTGVQTCALPISRKSARLPKSMRVPLRRFSSKTWVRPPRERPLIPADPAYEARVRESFSRQSHMATLGAEIVFIAPGEVHLAFPFEIGRASWRERVGHYG